MRVERISSGKNVITENDKGLRKPNKGKKNKQPRKGKRMKTPNPVKK